MTTRGLSTEPDFLIDTATVNRKYAARRHDPRRTWTGVTQVDIDCHGEQLQRKLHEAASRFIEAMGKRRWDLDSRVFFRGPYAAHSIDTSLITLGKHEYKIVAVFKMADTPQPCRTEIPTGLIKRDPEHQITLDEAKKAR